MPPPDKSSEVQIPLSVMTELLTELRASNEEVRKVVSLGQSVDSLKHSYAYA